MASQLCPQQKCNGYLVEKILNEGAMANAYRAVDSHGQLVFLKQYKSPSVRVRWYKPYVAYQNEMKRRIESNPALMPLTYRFIDFFESKDSGQRAFYQVFEFVSGGRDLREHLEDSAITWKQRMTFAKLLMGSMKNFHNADIIHCDLKPENLYLIPDTSIGTGYRFKVIDFDYSIFSDKTAPWDKSSAGDWAIGYAGTPGYMSPEHLTGGIPLEASDVFTCGLILYELLAKEGKPYQLDEDEYKDAVLHYKAKKPTLLDSFGSPEGDSAVSDILYRCLNPDPDSRPTAEEVHKTLIAAGGRKTLIPSASRPVPAAAPVTAPKPIPVPAPAPAVKQSLVLSSESGKTEKINLTTNIGKTFMARFGEESRFYSDTQYTLLKKDGEWYAVPNLSAVNDTIYNGKKITEKTLISDGDVLAVGKESAGIMKLPLNIKKD